MKKKPSFAQKTAQNEIARLSSMHRLIRKIE
jgi:hypothetical protein